MGRTSVRARTRGATGRARDSAAQLPFPDARFDLVTSFDVLYRLPDEVERAAIAEMFRVLKPGGRLILNVAALAVAARQPLGALGGEVRRYSKRRSAAGGSKPRASASPTAPTRTCRSCRWWRRCG